MKVPQVSKTKHQADLRGPQRPPHCPVFSIWMNGYWLKVNTLESCWLTGLFPTSFFHLPYLVRHQVWSIFSSKYPLNLCLSFHLHCYSLYNWHNFLDCISFLPAGPISKKPPHYNINACKIKCLIMSFSCLKICVALHCWSQSQVHKTAMSQVLPSLAPSTFPGTSPVHFAIYLE